jgi:hypothetical protein
MLRLLLVCLLIATSCRPRRDLSQYTQEDPKSQLTSNVSVANPKHEAQLKSGFHQLEQGGWRWVSGKFVVELRAPFASPKLGAVLTLTGNLPDILFAKTGPIVLNAKLNNTPLPAQPFKAAGEVVYKVNVPAQALAADQILVEFSTDKPLAPNTFPNDGRELALIVSSISLETKK